MSTAVMFVESEELVISAGDSLVVADCSDSTPSSSNTTRHNSGKSGRTVSPSRSRVLKRRHLTKKKGKQLYQHRKMKNNTAKRVKQMAMMRRAEEEETITPQKLKYLEDLARQNEREKIRLQLMRQRLAQMERDMQMMLSVAQLSRLDDYDFVFM